MYVNITATKRLFFYRACAFSCLGLCTSYDWRATALELSPKMHRILVYRLLGLLFMYSGHGMYSQATPWLVKACITVCDEFASNQLWVSLAGQTPHLHREESGHNAYTAFIFHSQQFVAKCKQYLSTWNIICAHVCGSLYVWCDICLFKLSKPINTTKNSRRVRNNLCIGISPYSSPHGCGVWPVRQAVSKQSWTTVLSIYMYLTLKTNLVQQKTPLYI